jgi:hypothetical protein
MNAEPQKVGLETGHAVIDCQFIFVVQSGLAVVY